MLVTERMADWQEYKWEGRDFSGKGLSANYVDNFAFSGLFQADYMFTPQFGLRCQYLYAPINKKAIYVGGKYYDADGNMRFFSDKNGNSHQITLQLEINMLNLFYRCRQNTQWGWYIGAGAGAMFYNIPKLTDNSTSPQFSEKYRPIVTIPINTSVEYSPISSLSVVLHAELDWYGDDELNGYDPDDQVNDMGLYVGLGVRYNICATKDPHVRLNDMCSYEPLTVGRSRKSSKFKTDDDDDKGRQTEREDIEELQDKMDELEKRNRELQDKIDLMNREIMERLDRYFQEKPSDTSGNDSSGSYSNEDSGSKQKSSSTSSQGRSSSTSKGSSSSKSAPSSTTRTTPVSVDAPNPPADESDDSSYRPSSAERKQQQIYVEAMQSNGTEANEVIFDPSSSRVKAKFEIKVATVARRMLANKKLKLDIFAYLTKAELTKTNVKLATDRLQAIYFILVNRYRIDPNRIKYDILEPSESDEGSDIRCDMVYR